jgi:hypothetical protein
VKIKTCSMIRSILFTAVILLIAGPFLGTDHAYAMTDYEKGYQKSYFVFYDAGKTIGSEEVKAGGSNTARYWADKANEMCYQNIKGLSGDQLRGTCDAAKTGTYNGYNEGYTKAQRGTS